MTLFTSTSRSLYQDCLDERRVFWVTDPGHGWLAVPLSEIDRLGIGPAISGYSYIGSDLHGYSGYALLEEDCDAGLYFEAVANQEPTRFACADDHQHGDATARQFRIDRHADDLPAFTFDQPRCSGNVAHNVRGLDSYASRKA